MNESEEQKFEERLKRELQPVDPPWECNREILETFLLKDQEDVKLSRRWEWLRHSWIAVGGLAASLMIAFVFMNPLNRDLDPMQNETVIDPIQMLPQRQSPALETAAMQYRAVGASNRLVDIQDLGWRETEGGAMAREYKYQYIDTVDLVNDEDGSVMRLEVPRDEIIKVQYDLI